jgi:hypothetical protein
MSSGGASNVSSTQGPCCPQACLPGTKRLSGTDPKSLGIKGFLQLSDVTQSSGEGGIRTPLDFSKKTAYFVQAGAEAGALTDPDLTRVVVAWRDLPEQIRAGILALVKAVRE